MLRCRFILKFSSDVEFIVPQTSAFDWNPEGNLDCILLVNSVIFDDYIRILRMVPTETVCYLTNLDSKL